MFQRQTKTKFSQLLIQIGQWENEIDQYRIILCKMNSFEPLSAFNEMSNNGQIDASSLIVFLQQNGIQEYIEWVEAFLKLNSMQQIPQSTMDYNEFLYFAMPKNDSELQGIVTDRGCSQKMNHEVGLGLSKLMQKEIDSIKNLENLKINLTSLPDYSPEQAFHKIDKEGTNMIIFETLYAYLNSICYVEENLVQSIIRYMDRDRDNILDFVSFCRILYPSIKNYRDKSGQQKCSLNEEKYFIPRQKQGASSHEMHQIICTIMRQIIMAEKEYEILKQDLMMCSDFNIENLFKHIDDDNTDLIPLIKFEEWLKSKFQIYPNYQQVHLLFRKYDKDRDGRLRFSDFLDMMLSKQKEYSCLMNLKSSQSEISESTYLCLRKLINTILIREEEIQETKIKLLQNQTIDFNDQFKWFDPTHTRRIDNSKLRKCLVYEGRVVSEKEGRYLLQRYEKEYIEMELFQQILSYN